MRSLLIPLALMLLLGVSFAQSHAKRLILKDGSYQPITEYKIEGDRVHFQSAERYDWEDIPTELIDWDATNKYNTDPIKSDRTRDLRDAADEAATEANKSEDEAPTVATGLRLPDSDIGGVYLLDDWHGQPELAEIVQNGAEVGQTSRKDVLRAALGSSHKAFEIAGAHAQVQSHVAKPEIFLCVEQSEKAVDVSDHYRIVRVASNVPKNTRSVATLNIKISGKTSESEKFVPSSAMKVNHGAWVKVAPNAPLEPGEYAVVEMLGDGEMNTYVWDFGVNPSAPENAGAKHARAN